MSWSTSVSKCLDIYLLIYHLTLTYSSPSLKSLFKLPLQLLNKLLLRVDLPLA